MTTLGWIPLTVFIPMAYCIYYTYQQYFVPTAELYSVLYNHYKSFHLSNDEKEWAIDIIENGYNFPAVFSDGSITTERGTVIVRGNT
jgi:hypothetical protein